MKKFGTPISNADGSFETRQANSFNFSREIVKPYGSMDGIVDWCKHELVNEWGWAIIEYSNDLTPGRYIFYFDSDRDACAFTLTWS